MTTAHEDLVLDEPVGDAGPADPDAFEDRLAALTIPIGDCVLLGAVLTGSPSVVTGGPARLDDLDVPGPGGRVERWHVDESHCPNPGCTCGEVFLHFVRGGSWALVRVRGNEPVPRVIRVAGTTSRLRANELLAAYAATFCPPGTAHDAAMVALAQRCRATDVAVKDAARRWVAARRAQPTWPPEDLDRTPPARSNDAPIVSCTTSPAALPSRNGPCPCGSGKKFKRCCGG